MTHRDIERAIYLGRHDAPPVLYTGLIVPTPPAADVVDEDREAVHQYYRNLPISRQLLDLRMRMYDTSSAPLEYEHAIREYQWWVPMIGKTLYEIGEELDHIFIVIGRDIFKTAYWPLIEFQGLVFECLRNLQRQPDNPQITLTMYHSHAQMEWNTRVTEGRPTLGEYVPGVSLNPSNARYRTLAQFGQYAAGTFDRLSNSSLRQMNNQ